MRGFAEFVAKSRLNAIGVTAFTMFIGPLGIIGCGVVALVTLRYGAREGLLVLGLAASVVTIMILAVGQGIQVVPVLLVLMAIWLLAIVLRQTSSQGIALTCAGLLGLVALAAVSLGPWDPVAWWQEMLERAFSPEAMGGQADAEFMARIEQMVRVLAPIMVGLQMAEKVIMTFATLCLGRYWHAQLDNPGGFGKEFRELRLDPRVAIVVAVIALLGYVNWNGGNQFGFNLLCLCIVVFLVQGLAVTHALVKSRGLPVVWLVFMYLALVFLWPVSVPLMSLLGLTDTWVDYRRRWAATGGQ